MLAFAHLCLTLSLTCTCSQKCIITVCQCSMFVQSFLIPFPVWIWENPHLDAPVGDAAEMWAAFVVCFFVVGLFYSHMRCI